MTNFTDNQIGQLATEAAAHGDMIGAAVYRKAIGYDYSTVDLSDLQRQYVDHLSVQECRDAALEAIENGIDMGDAELASDLETGSYQIAFMLEATGGFEVLEDFEAADDDAANEYAEQHYGDRPWYVLDSSGNNINGGPHQDD